MTENTGRITAADRAEAKFSWLTVAECAERLGKSPSHVRKLLKGGALKYANLGTGEVRPDYGIKEEWLVEFIESRTVKGEAAA